MANPALQEVPAAPRNGSNRPVYIQSPTDRALTELFELLVRARGFEAAESCFRTMRESPADKILAVGLHQYHARGNARRLTLTAELLTSLGESGADCLARFIERSSQATHELIFFIDAIAGADALSEARRSALLVSIAKRADENAAERLAEIVDSLEPDTASAVREALATRG